MTQSTERDRAEFEAWAKTFGLDLAGHGIYTHIETQAAWMAWNQQAARRAQVASDIYDFIEGMSVSVDVSTGEHDSGNRFFGTVTEVMEAPGDKHGVTLLVQNAEPNFVRAPVVPQGWKITEEMHVAAVKVLHRASGVDGLPQRMVDAMLAAAPQPPEANPVELHHIKTAAPVIPRFNHAAKRKLELLMGDGATVTGYAFQKKDGRRGSIDCGGFVAWWPEADIGNPIAKVNQQVAEAAPVQMPEPVAYLHECGKKPSLRTLEFSKVAVQLSAKGYKSLPLYTEHQVRELLARK